MIDHHLPTSALNFKVIWWVFLRFVFVFIFNNMFLFYVLVFGC